MNSKPEAGGSVAFAVGHEIGHAWRMDQGKVDIEQLPDFKSPSSMMSYYSAVNSSKVKEEIAASHIENIIRGEYVNSGTKTDLRDVYSHMIKYYYLFSTPTTPGITEMNPVNVKKEGYDYYRTDYEQKYQELKNEK